MSGRGAEGLRRLAVVDDDATTRRALQTLLEEEGWAVDTFPSAEEALAPLAAGAFDALVTDQVLPGLRGVELARRARAAHPTLRCVIISGYERPREVALSWVQKPIDFDALLAALAVPAG